MSVGLAVLIVGLVGLGLGSLAVGMSGRDRERHGETVEQSFIDLGVEIDELIRVTRAANRAADRVEAKLQKRDDKAGET